jgi:uncharacterized membrane protein (UPF0127 family)
MTLLVAMLLVAGACNEQDPAPLAAFGKSTMTLPEGRVLSVLIADTASLRQQGLSGVTELSGYDGMLFTFVEDTDTQFWMKDTLIALDIAFMSADGTVLQTLSMPICAADNDSCPRYGPPSRYRYALEAPAGSFTTWKLAANSQLQIR